MSTRTSVIVGANRGIGLELARGLVARGDRVIATARDVEAATALAEVGTSAVLALDIADDASIAAFAGALGELTDHVDLLVNNAGLNAGSVGHDGPAGVLEMGRSTLLAVTDVNAVGPMLVTQALEPMLAAAADGAWIVNISSQLGSMEIGLKMGRDVAYNVSKAALNMVTVCTARELVDRGIRSVAFHPGWVRTDMGGPSAALSPEESAAGILAKVDALSPDDNGGFFRWDGSPHPW